MNRGEVRLECRRILGDPKKPYTWVNEVLNDRINLWNKKITTESDLLKKLVTFSAIQYQRRYTLPTDFVSISKKWQVIFDGKKIEPIDIEKEDVESSNWRIQTAGTIPEGYYIDPTGEYLCLAPPPSAAADADAINNAADITAAATEITLDSTSEFDLKGSVLIDSEVIHYGYKSSTQLLFCERGSEASTAAIHLDDAVVTKRDIGMYYNWEPADMDTDDDIPFNGLLQYKDYHLAIVHAVVSMCLGTVPKKIEVALHQYGLYQKEEKKLSDTIRNPAYNPQRLTPDPRMLER